ncbi:MAG: hypothetical protein AB8B56_03715 [Crocinitomicaceae bacterium]
MSINIPNFYENSFAEGASSMGYIAGGENKYGPLYSAGSIESTDAFNQIAPRPRHKQQFDKVFRTEVRDPLFMLARQWQMGEFEFEDTGSAIFAKIAMDLTRLSRIKTNGVAETYEDSIPLETRIERQVMKFSLKEKVRLGEQWMKMLNEGGIVHNTSGDPGVFTYNNYLAFYLDMSDPMNHYSFSLTPELLVSDTDTSVIFSKAKKLTQTKEVQYRQLISGRKVDGLKVYEALKADITAFDEADSPNDLPFVQSVGLKFLTWVESLYSEPSDPVTDNCWNKESFTYNAEVSSPTVDNNGSPTDNRILKVKDYSSDQLDWHDFDEKPPASGGDDMADIDPTESVEPSETITMIPTPGNFPGMPATRWWEFEEGNVNIAGSNLSATDTVKAVLAEFALVFQDDWFVLPKFVPVGSTAKVKGIVVKDVFGQHTLVQHTSESPGISSDWSSWDMYSQSEATTSEGVDTTDDSLFFAPTTHDMMIGDTLEEVVFIRDEMANMVFAIEKKIWSDLGEGLDATEAASALKEFLLNKMPATMASTTDAELRYELGNTIPMNWIPFIPVHLGSGTNRAIQLQRASMPLILSDYDQIPLRPRTDFLRAGINNDDTLTASPKYFIQEEIIPRAGIKLQKRLQRTRWFDGKTYLWLSHSKSIGNGQGNSNLQFDRVLDSQKVEDV